MTVYYFILLMQKVIELILQNSPVDYVTSDTLQVILGSSGDSYYGIVKRALASGDLIKVRRGLYIPSEKYRRFRVSERVLSQKIYFPSYLSFEYALSLHGLIPDIIQRVLCASDCRSRVFKTPVGIYEYFHVPVKPFFHGVERRRDQSGEGYLIAGPERAICDLIYKRKLKWKNLSLITEGFRIEMGALCKLNKKLLIDISDNFSGKSVKIFINRLVEEINNVL